ncbi:hypothetical protein [Pandoraea aquatica]|uniref:hypothetical protein n=1 Tax=Pandoraea aquatica TaxID=2508290 RepID=UPI00123FE5B6|nr:hypothetical protein [Pandoraea aquatica]
MSVAAAGMAGAAAGAVGAMPEMRSPMGSAQRDAAVSDDPPSRKPTRRERRARGEEPGWLNSALVIGTAVFAAIALLGIWWNLRAPYVDPVPKPPGGLTVTPFNSGNDTPPLASSPVAGAASEASAALARAQALAAVDAAASGAAAEIAATTAGGGAPLTASAATAALTAAATSPSAVSPSNAPDPMMQLLSRSEAAAGNRAPPRTAANSDLPAHYDNDDIGAIAAVPPAQGPSEGATAAVASAPTAQTAAATIAAALAQCDRYRWFEVIPKQRCIWAVCNGRWGRDGCPAGTNPGESR